MQLKGPRIRPPSHQQQLLIKGARACADLARALSPGPPHGLSHRPPDLLLLDLMLPGLTGEEVLPKLEGIPTIVISAKAAIEDKVGLLLGGAADYVTKPFDTQEPGPQFKADPPHRLDAVAGPRGPQLAPQVADMDFQRAFHTVRQPGGDSPAYRRGRGDAGGL